jgi:uncharacterized DUF497 family protein
MEFEWDEAKRQDNLDKHELDFSFVEQLDWANAVIVPDLRFDYGEDRYRAFARIDGVLYSVVFVYRASATRILSFRRANRKERRLYG